LAEKKLVIIDTNGDWMRVLESEKGTYEQTIEDKEAELEQAKQDLEDALVA
jgi:hypothetical protein